MKKLLLIAVVSLMCSAGGCMADDRSGELLSARIAVYRARLEQVEGNIREGAPCFFIFKDPQAEEALLKVGAFKRLKISSDFIVDKSGNIVLNSDRNIKGFSLSVSDLERVNGVWECRLVQYGGKLSETLFRVLLKEEKTGWKIISFEVDTSSSS